MTGEDELIGWLREHLEAFGWRRLGDDAASLPPAPYVVTVDTQIAGVHFQADLDPRWVARRLLAVNLSDLAAMGAEPAYAFLALSAPRDFAHRDFFLALVEACRSAGVELAGGDLSTQPRLTAALTLLGRPAGRSVSRDGGRPGHVLWLGGPVGESALGCHLLGRGVRPASPDRPPDTEPPNTETQNPEPRSLEPQDLEPQDLEPQDLELQGLETLGENLTAGELEAAARALRRHLAPQPQLELGRWLATRPEGAAIDLSDGLARDLHRLCRASTTGAELDLASHPEALEPPPDAADLARRLDLDWRRLALAGGEDYVLLFSLPPGEMPPESFGCRRLGRLTRQPGVRLWESTGERIDLADSGWDHLVKEGSEESS